jgi:hypothetical protein
MSSLLILLDGNEASLKSLFPLMAKRLQFQSCLREYARSIGYQYDTK